MSLAAFHSRAADAAGPLLGGMSRSALGRRLEQTHLALVIDEGHAGLDGQQRGFELAVNLAARLYPALSIQAPAVLLTRTVACARAINPQIELLKPDAPTDVCLTWTAAPDARTVRVGARGWNALVDLPGEASADAAAPAAMAAAALGMGEIFRTVFADELGDRGRRAPQPQAINPISLDGLDDRVPLITSVELGTVHLAGAGAVGQAAVAALRELPVRGTLIAVDPETVDLGNLQRYTLTVLTDQGAAKTELIERALAASDVEVVGVPTVWGADERSGPGVQTLLSALDSKQGRIELAAGLARETFNAWTQADDLGVSWHEHFGAEPCLACLYWPTRARPSRLELIAEALGEHELRVSPYLQRGLPVGDVLPAEMISATRGRALPPDVETWTQRALLDDVAQRRGIDPAELRQFAPGTVERLYRDGVCAGMLLGDGETERPREVAVPLAHQSALAGILLACTLVAARADELRSHRPQGPTHARIDVLHGGQRRLLRRRERTDGCLCGDERFMTSYAQRWSATDA